MIRRRPDYRDRRGDEYVEPEEIYLVATAHTSAASAEAAARVIEAVKPHSVVLEMCKSRGGLTALNDSRLLDEVGWKAAAECECNWEIGGYIRGARTQILRLTYATYNTTQVGFPTLVRTALFGAGTAGQGEGEGAGAEDESASRRAALERCVFHDGKYTFTISPRLGWTCHAHLTTKR